MKNQNKFTPGPWYPCKYTENAIHAVEDIGYDRRICTFELCDDTRDTDLANARLIAAAPCMAQFIAEFIECGPSAGHNQDLIAEAKRLIEVINGNS